MIMVIIVSQSAITLYFIFAVHTCKLSYDAVALFFFPKEELF